MIISLFTIENLSKHANILILQQNNCLMNVVAAISSALVKYKNKIDIIDYIIKLTHCLYDVWLHDQKNRNES